MDYITSSGRNYTYQPEGPTAIELFESKEYGKCLHLLMFYFQFAPAENAKAALEDDGVLHELLHLVLGIETAIGNNLWEAIVEAEALFPHWVRAHKFLLCPGQVQSARDGQLHYVGAAAMQNLFQLRPDQCRIREAGKELSEFPGRILLSPQYSSYNILTSHGPHK